MSTITDTGGHVSTLQIAIELTPGAGPHWLLLNQNRGQSATGTRFVRFRAPDLRVAQRTHRQITWGREAAAPPGNGRLTMVDVQVLIRSDATDAMAALECHRLSTATSTPGLFFAGTAFGLAGLIADIHTAGVADGVTLIPADPVNDLTAIRAVTLPELAARKHYSYIDELVSRALSAAGNTMDTENMT